MFLVFSVQHRKREFSYIFFCSSSDLKMCILLLLSVSVLPRSIIPSSHLFDLYVEFSLFVFIIPRSAIVPRKNIPMAFICVENVFFVWMIFSFVIFCSPCSRSRSRSPSLSLPSHNVFWNGVVGESNLCTIGSEYTENIFCFHTALTPSLPLSSSFCCVHWQCTEMFISLRLQLNGKLMIQFLGICVAIPIYLGMFTTFIWHIVFNSIVEYKKEFSFYHFCFDFFFFLYFWCWSVSNVHFQQYCRSNKCDKNMHIWTW